MMFRRLMATLLHCYTFESLTIAIDNVVDVHGGEAVVISMCNFSHGVSVIMAVDTIVDVHRGESVTMAIGNVVDVHGL